MITNKKLQLLRINEKKRKEKKSTEYTLDYTKILIIMSGNTVSSTITIIFRYKIMFYKYINNNMININNSFPFHTFNKIQ
jgi:hypothetical protein